jgi:hypothetical protein
VCICYDIMIPVVMLRWCWMYIYSEVYVQCVKCMKWMYVCISPDAVEQGMDGIRETRDVSGCGGRRGRG